MSKDNKPKVAAVQAVDPTEIKKDEKNAHGALVVNREVLMGNVIREDY